MARAVERQARKLRAKGIPVDLEVLKKEYLSSHQNQQGSDSENEDEDPIDVVGDDEAEYLEHLKNIKSDFQDESESKDFNPDESKNSLRYNPFSIDSLLNNRT
jgi:homeobox protein Unc-4